MADAALDTIFKAYDIRGIYPDEIDEDIARRVGNSFVAFTGAARVLVGRDARPSSEPLVAAFIEGATMAGADVVDLGLASTDLCYFAAGSLEAPAAMFTASHNPAAYNGIKLCRAGAGPIGEETGLGEIKAMLAAGLYERGEDPGRVERLDLLPAFVAHVHSFVDLDALAPIRVVTDTANGVGGLIVPAVFSRPPVPRHDALRRPRRHVPEPSRRPDRGREPERPRARGGRRRRRRRARVRRRRRPRGARRRPGAAGLRLHHDRDPRRARSSAGSRPTPRSPTGGSCTT